MFDLATKMTTSKRSPSVLAAQQQKQQQRSIHWSRQFHRIGLLCVILVSLKLDSHGSLIEASPTARGQQQQQQVREENLGELVANYAAANNEQLNQHNNPTPTANRLATGWYLNNLRLRRQAQLSPTTATTTTAIKRATGDAGLSELQLALANSRHHQQSIGGDGLSQLPPQPTNQQLFEDEQAIRNQLPELIAQAHNDKQVERALLKMLINASLRSALSNMVSPSSSSQVSPRANTLSWLDGLANVDGSGAIGERLARLEQQQQLQQQNELINDPMAFATGDSSLDGGQQQQQYQSASLIDKREYIKPCSFNAISCVRTPFRKL